jgi:SAM-dependent methyltransferase
MKNTNPLITTCPNGCKGTLSDSDLILPEGVLKYCSTCGQLVSQCDEELYIKSNLEWDTTTGTWPTEKDLKRLKKRRERTIKRISAMLSKGYSDISLLDVGCSSGAFVWIAQDMGLKAQGVEPAEKPVKKALELGLKVHQGFLNEIAFPDNFFDAITLFEVIEHLDKPASLLKECHRILRPGGILVIGTGNTNSWTRRVRGSRWDFFDLHQHGGHINFFSNKSISFIATSTGFEVKRVRTSSFKLFEKNELPYLFYRIFKAFSELLNLPSTLLNKGDQMEAYLVSMKDR